MQRISGAGHVNHSFVAEDPATTRPPTEVTAEWLNDVQEELSAAAVIDGDVLGSSNNQLVGVLGARMRHFATGVALPTANIGPIWHDDYNSLMTWQIFNANGAAYAGYASALIGSLLIDTQSTPRAGYIKANGASLSRTAYAALRGWGIHNGRQVALGSWVAGTLAICDNADGVTFKAFDVRGVFPRFWDDGRGIDPARAFGSGQAQDFLSHGHNLETSSTCTAFGAYSITQGNGTGVVSAQVYPSGGSETRPVNAAFLSCIKY